MTRQNSNVIEFIVSSVKFLYNFGKAVVEKGRVKECAISTALLVGYYCILNNFPDANLACFVLPALIYIGYWYLMINVFPESWMGKSSNPNWNDENWWWALDGWEFEEEVAKVFRMNGYRAEVTKKTGDGGIDIILWKDGKKIICQCKHYQAPLGPEPVRALYGVKEDFRADEVLMIASSGLTSSSQDFIKNKSCYKAMSLKDIMKMASQV